MLIMLPGLIACVAYALATVIQFGAITRGQPSGMLVKSLGCLAVVGHGFTSWMKFTTEDGIDLGIYPMLSLMALTIAAIVLLSSLRRPVENLFILIFPIAMLSLGAHLGLPGDYTAREEVSDPLLAHIVLSVAAYSLITIAATQALLLSFGDNRLRHHQISLVRNLPPLETMEHLMFELIWAGLIFLTLSIATGFLFVESLAGPGLMHHTAITLAAWIVFAVLLWGRYQLGWRGAVASRWTLAGFALLVIGYFGSKIVLEVILGRA